MSGSKDFRDAIAAAKAGHTAKNKLDADFEAGLISEQEWNRRLDRLEAIDDMWLAYIPNPEQREAFARVCIYGKLN